MLLACLLHAGLVHVTCHNARAEVLLAECPALSQDATHVTYRRRSSPHGHNSDSLLASTWRGVPVPQLQVLVLARQ